MTKNKIEEIKTHPLFEELFTIDGELLTRIEQAMRDDSYDESQPIILATWEGQKEPVCIDGHTRLRAAINAGIAEVPVFSYTFDTGEEALEYAIRLQSNRRNLSDGDLIHCIERLHERRPRGGDRKTDDATSMPQSCGNGSEQPKESTPQCCGKQNGRSAAAKRTADLLNISSRKAEQALTVINKGSQEVKEAVLKNEISINKAYQKTQKQRKQEQAESSTENSEEKATDEGQEVEQGAESKESPFYAPVFVSMEHFGALHELGGLVEDHVTRAIKLYLESLQKHVPDRPAENNQEDDEDEYFDPDDFNDDLGLTI